jgi:hypothetical protein
MAILSITENFEIYDTITSCIKFKKMKYDLINFVGFDKHPDKIVRLWRKGGV